MSGDMPGTWRVSAPSGLVELRHPREPYTFGGTGQAGDESIASRSDNWLSFKEGSIRANHVLANGSFVSGDMPLPPVVFGQPRRQHLVDRLRRPCPTSGRQVEDSVVPMHFQNKDFSTVHPVIITQGIFRNARVVCWRQSSPRRSTRRPDIGPRSGDLLCCG